MAGPYRPYNRRMNTYERLAACLAATLLLAGCSGRGEPQQAPSSATGVPSAGTAASATPPEAHPAARAVVERFGSQMQKLSVLAPPAAVRAELPRVYGDVLAPELLARWRAHPDLAVGREGSSPWPQRIEIHKVDCGQPDACRVSGDVDYITSNEVEHGGVFMRRAVTLEVSRNAAGWRIAAIRLGRARR